MKILLSGGGTAGHINPAVAIAGYSVQRDSKNSALFVGTKKGLESTLVPKEGYNIEYVDVDGLSGKIGFKTAVSACKMAIATAKCIGIARRFKPDVVVGTGGYVCVPAVMAAYVLGIPSVIHEQNVFPGSAVKFLESRASRTAISFEESRKYLKGGNVVLTGNPIRPSILSRTGDRCKESLGLGGKKLIVCFGGSLGANAINDVMTDFIADNSENNDIAVYFATGRRDFERVMNIVREKKIRLGKNIKILEYIDNMDVVMNAADVLICRSGAITLAEICALGKPSVLVPSPNVTHNHQEYNARALSDNGAAITICEKDFNEKSLSDALFPLIYDSERAVRMSAEAKKLGITDATEKIYSLMENLVKASR